MASQHHAWVLWIGRQDMSKATPEQIPPEAVRAMWDAFHRSGISGEEVVAAIINAWPSSTTTDDKAYVRFLHPHFILPTKVS
jgi:hypothetical protein